MLGGGTFTTQNKVLPGTYMNFVSVAKANAELSERGICAIPMELNWGVDGDVFTVENTDFEKESLRIFGYSYDAEEVRNIREVFLHARTLHIYRLNSGEKAENDFATALCSGIRGNALKIVIQTNTEDESKFDVVTKQWKLKTGVLQMTILVINQHSCFILIKLFLTNFYLIKR